MVRADAGQGARTDKEAESRAEHPIGGECLRHITRSHTGDRSDDDDSYPVLSHTFARLAAPGTILLELRVELGVDFSIQSDRMRRPWARWPV